MSDTALVVSPQRRNLSRAAVIATAAIRDVQQRRGIITTSPMVWLGDVSYAFYLIQYPAMVIIVKYVMQGRSGGLGLWLLAVVEAFILSLVAAALIYHFVDKPITGRKPKKPKPHDFSDPPTRGSISAARG